MGPIVHLCLTELRAEWRNRQVLTTMVLLAVLTVLTFGFAGRAESGHLATPALWVSLALASAAGLVQLLGRHEATGVDEALLLSGTPRTALFLGQLGAIFLLLLLVALLDWLLCGLLWSTFGHVGLAASLTLGALGLAATGLTITLALAGSRAQSGRWVALMALPLALPILLLGSQSSLLLASGAPFTSAAGWLLLLALADLFWIVCGCLLAGRSSTV